VEFNIISIGIRIDCQQPLQLQQRIMLRGATHFPVACRSCVCPSPFAKCALCPSARSCQWWPVFGQELSRDPLALKLHQKPPLPFAFSFVTIDQATLLECSLTVVGSAINALAMLLDGFSRMIAGDEFQPAATVRELFSRNLQGEEVRLDSANRQYDPESLVILSSEALTEQLCWDKTELMISLTTPLKLVANGCQLSQFSFPHFMRSVMRRVSSLAYYYAGYEFNTDFRALSLLADLVTCTSSNFHKGMIAENAKLCGLLGSGCFSCDNEQLALFLAIGSYVNVGKGGAFGFGGYSIATR